MFSSQMPSYSRVWVYQASRFLNESEKDLIKKETGSFLQTWTAHNEQLMASFELKYDLFLILMVDEEQARASGCSIDKSVHFIQSLEAKLNVDFMNRLLFAYKDNGKIKIIPYMELGNLISSGIVTDETIVFNNLVKTRQELDENWEIPFKNSWHKQLV